jgi:hypothetical protein
MLDSNDYRVGLLTCGPNVSSHVLHGCTSLGAELWAGGSGLERAGSCLLSLPEVELLMPLLELLAVELAACLEPVVLATAEDFLVVFIYYHSI